MALSDELIQRTASENWNKGERKRSNIALTAKGLCQPDITIETLNMDKIIRVKSPDDVADIEEKTTAQALFQELDEITEQAHQRGIKMVWET